MSLWLSCASANQPKNPETGLGLVESFEAVESLVDLKAAQARAGFAEEAQSKWFRPTGRSHGVEESKPVAIAVLMHGLNNRPKIMDTLGRELADRGVWGLRGALFGHSGHPEDFVQATREHWLQDIWRLYLLAKKQADRYQVPLIYVGFSLGGLMGVEFQSRLVPRLVGFDAWMLFAPALSTRWYARIMSWTRFWPRLVIPTQSPPYYRAARGTPGAVYGELFSAIDALQALSSEPLRRPALVVIDPKDRLVSYSGLQDFIAERSLTSWQIFTVSTEGGSEQKSFHHLIVDDRTLSKEQWQALLGRIDVWLQEVSPKDRH